MNQPLYIDIETVPNDTLGRLCPHKALGRAAFDGVPDPQNVRDSAIKLVEVGLKEKRPPKEWWDALRALGENRVGVLSIEAELEKQDAEVVEKYSKWMSTTPGFCQIKSFAYAWGNEPIVFCDVPDSRGLPEQAACVVNEALESGRQIIGWGNKNFDIPAIRFAAKVTLWHKLNSKPWETEIVLDMMHVFHAMHQHWLSLKTASEMLGYVPTPGLEGVDGSQVRGMTSDELRAYNCEDIERIRYVHRAGIGRFWA